MEQLNKSIDTEIKAAKLNSTMRVVFDPVKFKAFYVDDPGSDMECVYDAFEQFFTNKTQWRIPCRSLEEAEALVHECIWPYTSGDYLVQRWINDGMACVEKINHE